MKKFLLLSFAVLTGIIAFANDSVVVNKRVLRAFEKGFPNAQTVAWSQSPDTYEARFADKGITTKVSYKEDGRLLNILRYYGEEYLPSYIKLNLQEDFPGKKIFGVTEMSTNDDIEDSLVVEYYIKMGDDKKWMTVKVNKKGDMKIIEKFNSGLEKRN